MNIRLLWIGLLGFALSGSLGAEPVLEVGVKDATYLRAGQPATMPLQPNALGTGVDGVTIRDVGGGWSGPQRVRDEVRYTLKDLPEGDYVLGLLVRSDTYFGASEFYSTRAHFFVNNDRWLATGNTEPLRPAGIAAPMYVSELQFGPLHLKSGDVFRALSFGACVPTIGPLRVYRADTAPPAIPLAMVQPPQGELFSTWVYAGWTDATTNDNTIRQGFQLYNPGTQPLSLDLEVEVRDALQRNLVKRRDSITLAPGQWLTNTCAFALGDSERTCLTVAATAPDHMPVRLVRYWVRDITQGPRPTLGLQGEWEMAWVSGAEPGTKPPADAAWVKTNLPSFIVATDRHCAWFRRVFDAPAHLQGGRLFLRSDALPSEVWVYLNGKLVGHELHGSQGFTMDVTAGFKPGEKNELLIAARDWLAYSPVNQERVQQGQPAILKDNMLDVTDYPETIGFGPIGPLQLEARPAVAVDDVFVVTSVRAKQLQLRYRVTNATERAQTVTLAPRVLDAGQSVIELPAQSINLPPHGSQIVTVEQPWTDPHFWSPEDPHLYVLETAVTPSNGGTADRHRQRFGFREFWIDGIRFVLNGTPVKIYSSYGVGAPGRGPGNAFWDPARRLEAIWYWQRTCTDAFRVQLGRAHLGARSEEAFSVADETGLLIQMEGEVHQLAFTWDERFWKAMVEHQVRLVDLYKNHPSIVIWCGGNENMWGWVYQGEKARDLANHWQVETVKAIEAFDLMKRPMCWEADSDLFGQAEYYSLHYPRELGGNPAVPPSAWWGPLDGTTVIKYTQGDVTLGKKPLQVGESFWARGSMASPYGQSILLGDNAYLGGTWQWRGWEESSVFFANGFRDVEFAHIDTLISLTQLPLQAVVLKEETASFFGGQAIVRNVNVHNDLPHPAPLQLRWSLIDDKGKTLAQGRQDMRLEPAELRRVKLILKLPVVKSAVSATWRVELYAVGTPSPKSGVRAALAVAMLKRVDEATRTWTIHPRAAVRAPDTLGLAVYDPEGATAAMLRKMGVRFAQLDKIELPMPPPGALLFGRNALKNATPGPWSEALANYVRNGGRVVLLEQDDLPDVLPVPLIQARERQTTIAFVRAADHPVLAGLTDADLRWWADDHYVSRSNFRKPVAGNWLPLADVGTMEGTLETPLLEEYDGQGSWLLCQFLLTDKAGVAPGATQLLQNLLNYLAAPAAFRMPGRTALFIGTNTALQAALTASQLVAEDLADRPDALKRADFEVAIADASALNDKLADILRAFAADGGRILLQGATPEQQPALEKLLGLTLRFDPVVKEPSDIQNRVMRLDGTGLLAGISNHEFFWASKAYLERIRSEGVWWSMYGTGCPPEERIADWYIAAADADAGKVQRLTRPGALLAVPIGQGVCVLCQARTDQPHADSAVSAARLRALLLTNLGATLQARRSSLAERSARLASYAFTPLDLAPFANRGLRDDPAAGIKGWSNQGENDMRALPTGLQTFAGVPFLIASPKAAVVLYSRSGEGNTDLPKEVTGIPVGRRADSLFFLHTSAYSGDGIIFRYRVNYADGTSVDVPIEGNRNALDWWADPVSRLDVMAAHNTVVAFRGDNPMRKGVLLVFFEWINPAPEKSWPQWMYSPSRTRASVRSPCWSAWPWA